MLGCAGDVPTLETLAAAAILRERLPELRVRVVNVVDLMRLQPETRASARALRPRVRRAVHDRAAGDLRLPRLPVADPPPDLPPRQPRQHPRARLQGGGHDDDAVRHGDAQRPRPLPPRDGRDRPRARPRRARRAACARRWSTSGCATAPTRASTARTRPTSRDWTWPGDAEQRARRVSEMTGRVRVLVVNAGSSSLKLTLLGDGR